MKDITKHPDYLFPHPIFKGEVFRKIPSSSKHEISNYGRIRIIGRRKRFYNGVISIRKTKILKPTLNRDGYIYVARGKKPHVLVLETFICPRPYKKAVNHKDGNKLNNHISNLCWVTWSENAIHAWANGLSKGKTKLKIGQVRFIRNSVENKLYQQKELAKMYNVSPSTIADIVHFRNWKNI